MVKKTYALSKHDAQKLISYACRYRSISTVVNEGGNSMTVYTTFADNDRPTSIADTFTLQVCSDTAPRMPESEYNRRVEGRYAQ